MSPERLAILTAVAIGGALGALARYGLALALVDPTFPWPTLAANVAGSFLIGWASDAFLRDGAPARPVVGAFVMAGFCGGFTTFSLFSMEALTLWRAGAQWAAAAYVGISLATWLPACAAGMRLGAALRADVRPGAC